MEIGLDSFVAATIDPKIGQAIEPARHLRELLEAIGLADEVGLDVFGIGEHHRREFLDSAPPVILAAAAARTRRIRLTSAVTVLSAADAYFVVCSHLARLKLDNRPRRPATFPAWNGWSGYD